MWLYALPRPQRTLALAFAVLLAPVIAVSVIADQADAIPQATTEPVIRQTLAGRTVSITSVLDCTQAEELHLELERIQGEWGWATSSRGTMDHGRRVWVNPESGWAGVVSWRELPDHRIRLYRSEMNLARLPLAHLQDRRSS